MAVNSKILMSLSRRSILAMPLAMPALALGAKSTDARIADVSFTFEDFLYRTPYKFGGKEVDRVTMLNVRCRITGRSGRSAEGFAAMPMGNVWSYPAPGVPYDTTLDAMKALAGKIAAITRSHREFGHPLDFNHLLEPEYLKAAAGVSVALGLRFPVPKLCTLVTASPFDAALHDAYGRLHGRNSFSLAGREFVRYDLAHYLNSEFRGEYLDPYISPRAIPRVRMYHYAGASDPLTSAEITKPVHDGLPETLEDWIPYSGISGGWGWGMLEVAVTKFATPVAYTTPTPCKNNIIEANNIHHFMLQRKDGGGVYTLGRQPGTVICYNCIHDAGPGAFGGIYLDEGSADIEACGNLLYNFQGHAYHLNNYLADFRDTCRIHGNSIVKTEGVKGSATKGGSGFDVVVPDPAVFTITAWVRLYNYPKSTDPRRWVICRGANPEADGNISLYVKDKNVCGSINIGGGEKNCFVAEGAGDPLKTNQWTQVALSYDADTLRVYCDGKEVGTCKVGKAYSPGTAPLTIGARADLISSFENGEIDEVSLFGRALAPEEIATAGKDTAGILKHVDFETQPDGNDFSNTESHSGPRNAGK